MRVPRLEYHKSLGTVACFQKHARVIVDEHEPSEMRAVLVFKGELNRSKCLSANSKRFKSYNQFASAVEDRIINVFQYWLVEEPCDSAVEEKSIGVVMIGQMMVNVFSKVMHVC